MAQPLEIRPIPEQPSIAAVRDDVVDVGVSVDQQAPTAGPGTERLLPQDARPQNRCDHKFIDSKFCLKCGWEPPSQRLREQLLENCWKRHESQQNCGFCDHCLAAAEIARLEAALAAQEASPQSLEAHRETCNICGDGDLLCEVGMDLSIEEASPQPGWLQGQIEQARADVASLPTWAKEVSAQPEIARAWSDNDVRQFLGWLSAEIVELHQVEIPRLEDALTRYLAARRQEDP